MSMWKLLGRCARDERGAEVLEYVVVAGVVMLACVALLGAMGIRLEGKWHRLLDLVRR